jgi:hypothetical protein
MDSILAFAKNSGALNGFHYILHCKGMTKREDSTGSAIYCGGDISSTDFDGGTDGFDDSSTSDSGDAGGCGGGD